MASRAKKTNRQGEKKKSRASGSAASKRAKSPSRPGQQTRHGGSQRVTAPEAQPRRGQQQQERSGSSGRQGGSWASGSRQERERGEDARDDRRQFERDAQRFGEQSERPHRRMNNEEDRRWLDARERSRDRGNPYDDDDRVLGEYGEREPGERWREREQFEGGSSRRYRDDDDVRAGERWREEDRGWSQGRGEGEGGQRYRDDARELRYQNEDDWRSDEQRFRGEDALRDRGYGDDQERWRDEGPAGQRGGYSGESHSGRRYAGRGWRELDDDRLERLEVDPGLNGTGRGSDDGRYIDRNRDWRRE